MHAKIIVRNNHLAETAVTSVVRRLGSGSDGPDQPRNQVILLFGVLGTFLLGSQGKRPTCRQQAFSIGFAAPPPGPGTGRDKLRRLCDRSKVWKPDRKSVV